MRIGLFGGSFDPPHAGHLHVASLALKRLRLDRVWWIVGPGNPLKDRRRLPASSDRLRAARDIARHPRMVATDFEAALGARYSVETLRFLLRRCPQVHFVWILGADSFATFHRWQAWREIAQLVPIAIVDRPGWTIPAQRGRAAATLGRGKLRGRDAPTLPGRKAPAWIFIEGPRSHLSSTVLRDKILKSLDRH